MITPRLQELIEELLRQHAGNADGDVARYIPELAKADPALFGISICTVEGERFSAGNAQHAFTLQSCSKPFVYGFALEDKGREAVQSRVGVEPTGDRFNSFVTLAEHAHRAHNPMVNAGAIAATALLAGADAPAQLTRILRGFETFAGRSLEVDMKVYLSERETGHRNRAIAHLLKTVGILGDADDIDRILDLYFQHCSVLATSDDLAAMAATLANGGVNPVTQKRALAPAFVRDLLSVMLTCGLYDTAGEWAYKVGVPAKSGVGGGLFGVVPGRMGIAVYSPLLDEKGTSVRGKRVFEDLSRALGLHIFDQGPSQQIESLLSKVELGL
jgi:glutaminase